MTLQSALTSAASGDNTTTHVVSVSAFGGALSSIVCWILELFHIMPTPEVEAAFGVLGAVAASVVLQRISS